VHFGIIAPDLDALSLLLSHHVNILNMDVGQGNDMRKANCSTVPTLD
jgi:hypothetical protein